MGLWPRQSSPLQPPKGALLPASGSTKARAKTDYHLETEPGLPGSLGHQKAQPKGCLFVYSRTQENSGLFSPEMSWILICHPPLEEKPRHLMAGRMSCIVAGKVLMR